MEKNTQENIKLLIKKAQNLSILYAEDEKILADKTATFLKKMFARVDLAEDGKEALDIYRKNKYDLVITDIMMPNMNGLELIENIRKSNQEQEIIINSAYTEMEFRALDRRYNVINHISKPIKIDEFVKILNDSIDKVNPEMKEES